MKTTVKTTVLNLTLLAIAAPIFFTSCATIFGRSSYPVSVNSAPSGATVSIIDKKNKEIYKGTTPANVILKSSAGYFSRAEYQVKISSAGYAEQVIPVNFKLNGWYIGNLLVGGLVGMLIIDPATGAMWKIETSSVYVTLNKLTSSIKTPTLKIIDIANVPQSMKDKLVRIK